MATPARQSKSSKSGEKLTDVRVVSRSDDGETFVAELFGEEEFTFSTDMNAYLVAGLASGDIHAVQKLLHSLLEVTPEDGEDLEQARRRIKDAFDECLERQRKLTFERLYRLINDLMVAAGNETATS